MITHALARNTIVPFFMSLFLVHNYYPNRTEKIYRVITKITYTLTPIYLIFMVLGINPITWILSPTWRAHQSTLQYIIYITATNHVLYQKTKDHGLSWTLALISATSAGYLYEIPFWIRRGGVFEIIRTAKTSFLFFDFGLIAFVYLMFMVKAYNTRVDTKLIIAAIIYILYNFIYWSQHPQGFIVLYQYTKIPTAVILRIPAMILTYTASTNIKPPEPQTRPSSSHLETA